MTAHSARAKAAGATEAAFRWAGPDTLVAGACLALALGALVYALDRGDSQAAGLAARAGFAAGPWFGAVGGWLPSFVHPLAFSLFTAVLRGPAASPCYLACGGWWLVHIGFELVQHPQLSPVVALHLQRALGPSALARILSDYGLRGTFDRADLIAATAGALAAAAALHLAHRVESKYAN